MPKSVNHKRGLDIVVNPAFARKRGAVLTSRERPPSQAPKRVVTTWECINCGNSIRSTRGMSRCPKCGSIEMIRVAAPTPQHQQNVTLPGYFGFVYSRAIEEDGYTLEDDNHIEKELEVDKE